MFNRIRKVKDFRKFTEDLRRLEPSSILVEASREPARGMFGTSMTGAVGRLGEYDHALLYTVRLNKKSKRFWEPLFRVFQSEWGFADSLERNKRVMSVLLAGEKRADHLRAHFPGTLVQLGDGHGRPMPPENIDLLHEQAEKYSVTSAI